MTFFPCATCEHLVEAEGEGRCLHCGAERPFRCCRCGTHLALADLHQPDRLYPGKLLYCVPCGEALEVVECGTCGIRLLRSEGRVTAAGTVHHHRCLRKGFLAYRLVHPFLVIGLAAVLGFGVYHLDPTAWGSVAAAGALGAAGGEVLARRLRPR